MPRVATKAAEIHYEVHGEGRPLVFAHGAGGNAAIWWQQVPFFRERGYRVVTFDHRAFGRSICASDDFDPAEFPNDLAAILDACGIERAALVCQSMGGWTGLPFTLANPDRVSALALCGTPGGVWNEAVAQAFAGLGARIAADGGIVGPGGPALGVSFKERDPTGAFLYDQIAGFNPGLEPAAVARLAGVRLNEQDLAAFDTPTRVLSGDEDVIFPREALVTVADAIPGARFVAFDGAGHSTYFEKPARFNELILDFLEANP